MSTGTSDAFEKHLADWRAYTAQPWARIRYAVVAEVLSRHLSGERLRVLDVGGGDGLDSLPLARAGHRVTVLDTAPGMLAEARRRAEDAGVGDRFTTVEASVEDLPGSASYDVVLCHFVLHYRDAGEQRADVRRLAGEAAPGGLVSLVAPNPANRVLSGLVRRGPGAAFAELQSDRWESVTFAHPGRQVESADAAVDLEATGLSVVGEYGGRIANDLLTDDAAKQDPAYYAELERLEIALCDRDPYRRIGMFWQLVARKP